MGIIPQLAKGPVCSQWGANSSVATVNFLLLPRGGGRRCPHISAALCIIRKRSPNPPTAVVEVTLVR